VQNGRAAFGAVTLQEETGIPFAADVFPRYFAGHFDARLVLVHAMPRLGDAEPKTYRDFGDYVSHHTSLHDAAGGASRAVVFMQEFSHTTIETAAGSTEPVLELYFIPYGARPFASRKLNGRLFRHEYDRLMTVITAYPRDCIIFCGAAFERLLGPHILVRIDHQFRLPTRSGLSKSEYRFSVVDLLSCGRPVRAAIAQSFAMRTTPISAYGRLCQERYLNGRRPHQDNTAS
jgi:hypothetical protein